MPIQTIGDCIRACREARQWSLQELANRTGLSRNVISSYEVNRISNVPSRSIILLAQAFGLEPGALYPKQRVSKRGKESPPKELSHA